MKQFATLAFVFILAAAVPCTSLAATHRTAADVPYVPTKELVISPVFDTGKRIEYRGFTWENQTGVPCQLKSFAERTWFIVYCLNRPEVQGDLRGFVRGEIVHLWTE